MTTTFAFDVYGTLVNTHGLVEQLRQLMGEQANAFSQTWRDKQLEYSFRRGLMRAYQPFSVCTRQALDYACELHRQQLSSSQKQQLLQSYLRLPAFEDVKPALSVLKQRGDRLFAFSNGEAASLEPLLSHAQLTDYFDGIVSCDELETFKPNPEVYQYLIDETGSPDVWLVSSNPFDVIGAISSGLQAAWVKRSEQAVYDPWDVAASSVITDLTQLAGDQGSVSRH